MSALALEAKNLTMQFGGLKAVSELTLQIPKQAIFGLIGPNGAGKTTVFNMLTGVYQPTLGEVFAFGKSLSGLKAAEICRQGLARTFQNIRLFKNLSLEQNLMVACDAAPQFDEPGLVSGLFQSPRVLAQEKSKRDEARRLLKIFDLETRADWLAKNLPYGDQRRLEIARAMATGAKLLLLDEPAAGMNHGETAQLMATIRKIRDEFGITILLIEHDMKLVMGICERIAVLDYGTKIAEGLPGEIQKNERVIEAYLGRPKEKNG